MVRKYPFIICLMFLFAVSVFSEEHQRIGVEKKVSHLIKIDGGITLSADKLNEADIYTGFPEFSISYISSDTWYSIIATSFKNIINMQDDYYPSSAFAPGDPSISVGYLKRLGDYKLRLECFYSYPLGIWNSYEVKEKKIQSSSGYQMTALTFSLSRILDPVILNTTFRYGVGLPRKDRYGWSMTPGDIAFSFSLIEVLNDEIGIQIGLSNNIYLPVIRSWNMDYEETSYFLSLSVALLWHKDHLDSSMTISKDISTASSSPNIKMEGGWEIEINEKDK